MRPPHLRNDVDVSVLSVLKRILVEVPDLHPSVAEPVVALLSGTIDSAAAHYRMLGARMSYALDSTLLGELQGMLNYFCPVPKETRDSFLHHNRAYWDSKCRTCIADITRILDKQSHETSAPDH